VTPAATEPQIALFLNEKGADYLITFPEFYPLLSSGMEQVFSTNSEITLTFGQQNMVVYLWKNP